jgi:hypothetical protein
VIRLNVIDQTVHVQVWQPAPDGARVISCSEPKSEISGALYWRSGFVDSGICSSMCDVSDMNHPIQYKDKQRVCIWSKLEIIFQSLKYIVYGRQADSTISRVGFRGQIISPEEIDIL